MCLNRSVDKAASSPVVVVVIAGVAHYPSSTYQGVPRFHMIHQILRTLNRTQAPAHLLPLIAAGSATAFFA